MAKVKLGLIGAGGIAKLHLDVIRSFDWIEPVGITSLTKAHREEAAEQYGIPVAAANIEALVPKTQQQNKQKFY